MNYSITADKPLTDSFEIGSIVIEPSSNTIINNGARHRIEPRLMSLMVRLYSAMGEVVSRDELLNDVWHDQPGSDEALTQAISRLRREIGDSSNQPTIIETIPKRGYRMRQLATTPHTQSTNQPAKGSGFSINQNSMLWMAILLLLGLYLHSIVIAPTEQHEIEIILDPPTHSTGG